MIESGKKPANNDALLSGTGFLQSLEQVITAVLRDRTPAEVNGLLTSIIDGLQEAGLTLPGLISTPYVNTIATEDEPEYPGDQEIERRIKSYIRWNAMAMVVKANTKHAGIGGHISTYASLATLYEVGFNHFFRGASGGRPADMIYFQGHASPGVYARAYLEGRMEATQLHNFRRELAEGGGLSSYPHPYLMPDFWQFPTVSMGLGPIMSIYQARFNRYLRDRSLIEDTHEPKVWCYVGDGESDEPETRGAISLAGREKLDNLVWVINCNLQRLDGPVRGNGKIIQELESLFLGAGWNVIKVVWGSDWDPLLEADEDGLLVQRMEETVDGEYQKYSVESGGYARTHFFGKYPELAKRVNHLTDAQIHKMRRGGHDPRKVHAAYQAAMDNKGSPTVILAKTIKGYGLGEAGEGRNISHQQKALNEKELREFRDRFGVPIADEDIADAPFYRPPPDSVEMQYLLKQRESLDGFVPTRTVGKERLELPTVEIYKELHGGSKSAVSTTMAFVRLLTKLLDDKNIGDRIVPIIPDEARTFGMDSLFRRHGIYNSAGQNYEPVDRSNLLYYREATDGQILEEGISESGAMSSFLAAGVSYSSVGKVMVPFYIFYSMFGFQRIGDLAWAGGDMRARGFLLGATAGRTTLNGEGLQHQDGHGHLLAATYPHVLSYDPAFGYEVAVIVEDGMRRMYADDEDLIYYITLQNENYPMPAMPEGSETGILNGLYKFKPGPEGLGHRVQIFGSGSILNEALRAQQILAEQYDVSADVWSATSYKALRAGALEAQRWNMLHPGEEPRKSYLETTLEAETGPFIAVSDCMKLVSDQIAPWVPDGLFSLGTDGFGRSETREALRRFFEVDAESTVVASLYALSLKGSISPETVSQAMNKFGISPDKSAPVLV